MSNEHKKEPKQFPKYRLIVDDTGNGSEKYHVGYLTSKISAEQLSGLEAMFVKSHDKCLQKIDEIVSCTNRVLDQLSEAMNLGDARIKPVGEVHANAILSHINNFQKQLEDKKILPVKNAEVAQILKTDKNFKKLYDLAKKIDPAMTEEEIFSGDANHVFNKFFSVTKKLVCDSFFEYAERLADIVSEQDLKIIYSTRPSLDSKLLMENSDIELPRKNDSKLKEVLSLADLVTKTLGLIEETDQSNQIHVQVLCDNGIRKNTTNIVLHNHKELHPFSIRKVTANFMESNGNALIESADAIAWMNNRFENALMKKIKKQELTYVDKRVFDLFTNKLMGYFAESNYDRLTILLQEAGVKMKITDKTNQQFVERTLESFKEQ